MIWLRLYTNIVNNIKIQSLPGDVFKTWVNLICIAKDREQDGLLPSIDELSFMLRQSVSLTESHIKILIDKKLLDKSEGKFTVHDWSIWQYDSDSSTPRVRRHRNKKEKDPTPAVTRNVTETFHETHDETLGNVTETFHETEGAVTRNVSETVQKERIERAEKKEQSRFIAPKETEEVFERCYSASWKKRDRVLAQQYFVEALENGAKLHDIERRWGDLNRKYNSPEGKYLPQKQSLAEWLKDGNWMYEVESQAQDDSDELIRLTRERLAPRIGGR